MNSISLRKGETPNETTLTLSGITIWFSYETPVAFTFRGKRVVRVNDWSTTTGKHLNRIDGGGSAQADRIPGDEFTSLLEHALDLLGVNA